jgi:hypothetical protein
MEAADRQDAASPNPVRKPRRPQAVGKRPKGYWKRTRPAPLVRAEMDGRTVSAKLFDRVVGDIQGDLGGKESCSTIELNLIEAFAGVVLQLEALNCQQLLGKPIDLPIYCLAASTLVRVATRLGVSRRPRTVEGEETLAGYLRAYEQPDAEEPEAAP